MQIVLLYLLTVIMSFILELDNGFMMFKDVADAGYKIDIERMSEFMKQIKNNQNNNSLLRLLIPFYNIYKAMQLRMEYIQQRFYILDQLRVLESLDEMTDDEKLEYEKKPTGLNAIIVSVKSSTEKSNEENEEINLMGEKDDWIWYNKDEKTGQITIFKTEGIFCNMSVVEQRRYILTRERPIVEQPEEIKKSYIKISEGDKGRTTTEKIEDLTKLRDILVDSEKTKEEKAQAMLEFYKELYEPEEKKGYQKKHTRK